MAKSNLNNIPWANTSFRTWHDKTNEIIDIIKSDSITASVLGDTTTGNATLQGSFTANTVVIDDILQVNTISAKSGSSNIDITAPVSITASNQLVNTITSVQGARMAYSSGTIIWRTGFRDTVDNNFIIDTGVGTDKFTLTPDGNLAIPGELTANTIAGELSGDVTGNVTGSISVPEGGIADLSEGDVDLPEGFGIVPRGGIIMYTGDTAPAGYAFCHGQTVTFNGVTTTTPDLRDRFIVGSGTTYNIDDTGGAAAVALTVNQLPSHTHSADGLGVHAAGSHTHGASSSTAGNHRHYVSGSTSTTGSHAHSVYYGTGGGGSYPDIDDLSAAAAGTRNTNSAGNHAHSFAAYTTTTGNHSHSIYINAGGNHTHTLYGTSGYTGSDAAHENRPPYYALAYIIKL